MSSDDTSIVLVKRPRRATPKARTGCATCKIRRVKCGEERPSCIRCSSTGRKCPGYANSEKSKNQFGTFAINLDNASPYGLSNRKVSDDNVQYLEFYHHCAVPTISTSFDKDFWARIPLQLAQNERSVRSALLALSCLNKSETGTLKDARSGLLIPAKQKDMLLHYNKSVKLLVRRISEPSYTPEVGLVCCLLFVCIENLRGNYTTAMDHYKSGLNILASHRKKQLRSSPRPQADHMIEHVLTPIYARMLLTAIAFGLPTEQVFFTSRDGENIRDFAFSTVAEAELSMIDLRSRAIILGRIIGTKLIVQGSLTDDDQQIIDDCLEVQGNWLRAVRDLERTITPTKEDVITLNVLKAQHYCLYIITHRTVPAAHTGYDQLFPLFKVLLHHSKLAIDSMQQSRSSSPAANFTFEMGLIIGLYTTACRCRCPSTRREAIALLERDLPREGLWDAQQHLVVAKRIIELEESELDPITGWPSERARIWSAQIHGDVDRDGKFQVWFAKGHWGEGRGSPPLPPQWVLDKFPRTEIWREWFVL